MTLEDEAIAFTPSEPLDQQRLGELYELLQHWGFRPGHETRAATAADLRMLRGWPTVQEHTRERGILVYISPLRVRRSVDGVDGRAFDALRTSLENLGGTVTESHLRGLVQRARLDNLPARTPAHHYFM